MKDNYIAAVLQKIEAGDDIGTVITGLKSALDKKGHQNLYAQILRGVNRVLEANSATDTVVTVKSSDSYEKQSAAIKAALETLGSTSEPAVVIDETIVGGFVAEANNRRIDQSYKSKLIALYRNLTK